jgi:hypothetical protein
MNVKAILVVAYPNQKFLVKLGGKSCPLKNMGCRLQNTSGVAGLFPPFPFSWTGQQKKICMPAFLRMWPKK